MTNFESYYEMWTYIRGSFIYRGKEGLLYGKREKIECVRLIGNVTLKRDHQPLWFPWKFPFFSNIIYKETESRCHLSAQRCDNFFQARALFFNTNSNNVSIANSIKYFIVGSRRKFFRVFVQKEIVYPKKF